MCMKVLMNVNETWQDYVVLSPGNDTLATVLSYNNYAHAAVTYITP